MKKIITFGMLLLLGAIGSVFAESTAVPKLINYQGKLTDSVGEPLVATSNQTLSFKIFNKPVSDPAIEDDGLIWGPQIFNDDPDNKGVGYGAKVPVVNGFFNVILGPKDIDGDSIVTAFTKPDRYLEITIGDPGVAISPRQQVLSTPYALQTPGSVPVGSVIPFYGDIIDLSDNWKYCDGTVVNDVDSPLNGQISPDLRNKFIRGTSSSFGSKSVGGSNDHAHSFYDFSDTVWFPQESVHSTYGGYNPATTATAFDFTKRVLQFEDGAISPKKSHGHSNGQVVISGTTGSGLNIPVNQTMHFIIRIK